MIHYVMWFTQIWLFSSQLYGHPRPVAVSSYCSEGNMEIMSYITLCWTFINWLGFQCLLYSMKFPFAILTPFYATEYLIGLIFALPVVLYYFLQFISFTLPVIYLFRDEHYIHLLIPASFPSISECSHFFQLLSCT